MAEVARATGRLDVAEDSVQDACVVAVQQWTAGHVPRDPQAWLTGVARHKALDRLRREARRPAKEATGAAGAPGADTGAAGQARSAEEDLWLIYLCCHPALSPEARIALTLRAVGGLTTAEIAAAFLVPEATMAKRLTRAKNKIRDSGLALAMPRAELLRYLLEASEALDTTDVERRLVEAGFGEVQRNRPTPVVIHARRCSPVT